LQYKQLLTYRESILWPTLVGIGLLAMAI